LCILYYIFYNIFLHPVVLENIRTYSSFVTVFWYLLSNLPITPLSYSSQTLVTTIPFSSCQRSLVETTYMSDPLLLVFCAWLISLSIMISSSIYVASNDRILLLRLNNIPLCMCTTCSLSIHPSMDTSIDRISWLV
jgi:hypothetical protein